MPCFVHSDFPVTVQNASMMQMIGLDWVGCSGEQRDTEQVDNLLQHYGHLDKYDTLFEVS